MNNAKIILCASMLFCGIITYMYLSEWFIIQTPIVYKNIESIHTSRKNITIYLWHKDTLLHEKTEILWNKDQLRENIEAITSAWLILFSEYQEIAKKTKLQSVLLNERNTIVYLSFEQSLFNSQASLYEKWQITESLLKTLHEVFPKLQHTQFLINHKPYLDSHLNFHTAWPMSGF